MNIIFKVYVLRCLSIRIQFFFLLILKVARGCLLRLFRANFVSFRLLRELASRQIRIRLSRNQKKKTTAAQSCALWIRENHEFIHLAATTTTTTTAQFFFSITEIEPIRILSRKKYHLNTRDIGWQKKRYWKSTNLLLLRVRKRSLNSQYHIIHTTSH